MMSRICLCCLADQNLVVLGDEEWRIYDLILNLSKKNVFNYKFFLEELKSSNAGRICSKCQYTLTYVEKFRRNTCLNFQKLLDIWNESGASTSYSKINVDPLESEEVFIKSDPDDDDDDDKNSSKEDDQNECLMETAPSSPSTVSVKSDDIKRIKEEALDSEVENESFETDMETQINSAVITKNAVDTSLQLKGSPIQGVRVTAKTFAANDPNQKRSPIQKVPVTANNSASKDPQQTRSLIQRVIVTPATSESNDLKQARSLIQRVIVTPATSESNDLKQARLPFQGVRVTPNEPKPTRVRSNQTQIRILVDYMSNHKNFANGEYSGPMGSQQHLQQWEVLRAMLNEHGPKKSVEQWRHTWRDLKKKAREEGARVEKARATPGNPAHEPGLSELNNKILGIIFGLNGTEETGIGTFLIQPVPIQDSASSSVQESIPDTLQQQPTEQTESVGHHFMVQHEYLPEWSETVLPEPQDTKIGLVKVEPISVTSVETADLCRPQEPKLPTNTSQQHRGTRLKAAEFLAAEHATTNVLQDILKTLKAQNQMLQERNKSVNLQNRLTNRERAPIHEVRVMTNTSASGNLEQTRLELRGGISVTVGSATSADNPDPTRDRGKRVIYSENYKRVRPDGCQCRLCHPEAYKPEPPGPPRKFPCPICHKEFTSRGSLWSHKYNMHQDNKVYCEPCDEWFKQARYKMHLRISAKHNEEVNIRVTCEECKKPVIKAFLKRHMDSHKRTRYCKTCDKWFTKAGYKTHMTSNLKHVTRDDFKYSCDICKGKFVTITATERHMQIIHLKLLPYKCPHCPAAYKYRGTLTKHVLTVHEKKPVPKKCICHVCGAAWETECLLKNHMVVHTGERPYKCKVCDATFGFSGALYTHNKLKHLKKKRDTRTQTKERKTKRNAKKKKQMDTETK